MAADRLTVAVTGPTGDLGIAIVNALERSRAVKSIVGMARRPFDPAERGWKKTEYRQGDVTDAASVRELVKGADVVVHLAFAILERERRDAGAERGGLAARVRGGGEGRRQAHLLRVERRGLRLPRRQPGLADRGHPGARLARASVLAAEGRGRARARRGAAAPPEHGGLRVPALHRRRPRGAHDARGDPLLPPQRGDARAGGAPARLAARAEARDPGPRHPLPARARGRRGERVRRRRARARRARALQPRRRAARSRCRTWPTRSAGTRCRCRSRSWTPPPRWPRACRSCPRRWPGSTRSGSRS